MHFATKGEDTFVVSGFDNWKKAHERFVKHADSGTHKEALLKIELMKQDGIDSSLSKQLQADQKVHRDYYVDQAIDLSEILGQARISNKEK